MSGRLWAYVGVALGGSVSVAANVAHSYVVNPNPPALAVVVSVFWPVALFVTVEILARTEWPAGKRWVLLRFAGLLPVAVVAAVVSYRHLSGLLAHYGEDPLTVAIGPLAVDGLMLVATGALIATGKTRTAAPAPVPVSDSAAVCSIEHADPPVPAPTNVGKIEPANPQVNEWCSETANSRNLNEPPESRQHFDDREAAREVYRQSVAAGKPLSGAELARRFGKSPRWGVDRVHEVRAEIASANGKPTDLAGVAS